MNKAIVMLTVGLMLGLSVVSVARADEGQTRPDDKQCTLKTDLSADMVAKCTEAMAKASKAMLEGCCQEEGGLKS